MLLLALGIAGCASNSAVVKIGEDTYKIYRRAATGFASETTIREMIVLEASEYCIRQGKVSKVLQIRRESSPIHFG